MSPKTKKPVLIKVMPCHHWGKYSLKNSAFTLESAHKLLIELQAKKADHSAKGKLKMFDTGFKLSKRGSLFSDKLPLTSIIRFFVFKTEPHLIFLGVEKKKKRLYYAILFRDLAEVNEVCDLIERNRAGKGETDINMHPHDNEDCGHRPPVIVIEESRPVEQVPEKKRTVEVPHHEVQEETIVCVPFQKAEESRPPIAPNKYEPVRVVKPNVEYHYNDPHTDDIGNTKIDALLWRTSRRVSRSELHEDMRYLEYNPQLGTTQETEAGPIYMYTAHFTPAEYQTVGSCESDSSDDGWSEHSRDSCHSSNDHTGIVVCKTDGRTIVMANRATDSHASHF